MRAGERSFVSVFALSGLVWFGVARSGQVRPSVCLLKGARPFGPARLASDNNLIAITPASRWPLQLPVRAGGRALFASAGTWPSLAAGGHTGSRALAGFRGLSDLRARGLAARRAPPGRRVVPGAPGAPARRPAIWLGPAQGTISRANIDLRLATGKRLAGAPARRWLAARSARRRSHARRRPNLLPRRPERTSCAPTGPKSEPLAGGGAQ